VIAVFNLYSKARINYKVSLNAVKVGPILCKPQSRDSIKL